MSVPPAAVPALSPPPPPGLNYIAAIKPSLSLLMIGTVWSAMLIPLLVVLVFLSTSSLRRQPLFIMNIAAVLVGLVLGIMNGYLEISAILSPLTPVKGLIFMPFVTMIMYLPVLIDMILLFRLYVVYPPRSLSWTRRLVVFGPPVTFKIVRVVNLIVFLVQWTSLVQARESPLVAGQTLWGAQPWTKIEWFFQVFENFYASTLFLLRVHKGKAANAQSNVFYSGGRSHASKLKSLFYIALGNFVFPCVLSLVQLIFLFRDPSFLDGSYVFLTNVYVEIIGVLMATIWVAGGQWSDQTAQGSAAQSSSFHPTRIHISRSVTDDRGMPRDDEVEMNVLTGRVPSPKLHCTDSVDELTENTVKRETRVL
ncbi:hypothetical protein DFH06DRAFT_1332867 [Mycena polygramma]|nr:hypothetical protein DFH06DRAFT_1332867 [Mycena polygramma]